MVVKAASNLPNGLLITNRAAVGSSTPDPYLSNNNASAVTQAFSDADIEVIKTPVTNPVIAGQPLVWNIKVTNKGPSKAINVEIKDLIPTGLTLTNITTTQGVCIGQICQLGDMAANAVVTLTVTTMVDPSVPNGTQLCNTAIRFSDTPDPNTANDTSVSCVTVITRADLSVTKTGTPNPVVAGNNLTYTLLVQNLGPSDAQNVVINDPLPAGVTLISATPAQTSGPNPLVWDLGTMAAGQSKTITVVVKVDSSQTANLSNTVTVTSSTTDPVPSNNTDTEPTVVITQADVSVVKTASASVSSPGDSLTYTLKVKNNGPSDAQNVVVQDTLPAGVTFVSASPAQSSGPNPLTWNLGVVTAGQTKTITIVVTVNSNASGQITNLVSVTSSTTDPDPTNNSSSVTTDIVNQADVKITKYGPQTAVRAETEFTYTIVVQNLGPAVARNVVVVDSLPVEVSYVSASPVAVQTNNTLTWYLGDLQPGETRLVYLTVFVEPWANVGCPTSQPSFTNVVSITSNTPDPDLNNNSDSE